MTHVVKLSQVDLNLLVTLDAIIKERSVTRAGRTVGLSQPAMSAALGRLRHLFGDPLLERVGRDYRLTPLALALAEPLQKILMSIERTLDQNSAFEPATAKRTFRIAASDYVICVLLQPLLQRMCKEAPGVKLQFQAAGNDTAKQLAAHHIDMSIQPAGTHRGFQSETLFSDRWMCAVWNGNTQVGAQITREQFCKLSHVTYAHPPFNRTLADHFVGAVAKELQVQVMSDSFVAMPLLLRGTELITLVQARLGEQVKKTAEIRVLAPPVEIEELVMAMWWNPLHSKDPAHTWLRETLSEIAKHSDGAEAALP
jgi:LysR family transcriptional regulator, nod-box dependent transcriptional activator